MEIGLITVQQNLMKRRYTELICIILADKVKGHRMSRMGHLYGLEDQTVCEPKACRIQYKTVTTIETKESTAVLKAGT